MPGTPPAADFALGVYTAKTSTRSEFPLCVPVDVRTNAPSFVFGKSYFLISELLPSKSFFLGGGRRFFAVFEARAVTAGRGPDVDDDGLPEAARNVEAGQKQRGRQDPPKGPATEVRSRPTRTFGRRRRCHQAAILNAG